MEIVRGADRRADEVVDDQERREVGVDVKLADVGLYRELHAILRGEFGEGLRADRAFEVEVQLGLGDAAGERCDVHRRSST